MALETATYIDGLVTTNPTGLDPKSQGDDHIRLLKSTIKATLPNITGPVTASQAELNILDGATLSTAELNVLDGVTASTAELNILDGVTATAAELNVLDGITSSTAELNILDGVTVTASDLNTVTTRALKAGDTYTGAHDFTGATVSVATQTAGDSSNKPASTAFVAAAAFASALPSQTGNAGKFVTTNGTDASWADAVTPTGVQTLTNKTLTSLNGGQLAGLRNKIINGKMEIAQRGTSFAAAGIGAYSLDRWRWSANTGPGVVTISQQADTPSSEFQNSLRVTVTTADTPIGAGDRYSFAQRIEGYDARDLIGRTFTLSFWVRSSKTGVHCVSFVNSGADRAYVSEYTVNVANTWEQKSITVSGGLITAGTWDWASGIGLGVNWALAADSTVQTTPDTWQTGFFSATANQVNCLDTIGNIFAITGAQLEVGTVATPFEHRPYGMELALCRRYTRVQAYQVPATTAQNLGTIDMRATPTITGGGAGFTSTNTTSDQLIAFQTAAAVQTLTLAAEL